MLQCRRVFADVHGNTAALHATSFLGVKSIDDESSDY